MSGQQIGTVVGGVVGAFFGVPQLGMAVGGLIGGLVDPTKINGPQIGDGQAQTSTDGVPIAWVQGTARIAGTLVQYSPRRQVKVKDSGKGGPSVHHYEAHQDFAILVCESCSLRDSTMSQVLIVEQDGHIVYDVRPGSTILSDSAKWKANVDFCFGAEDQLPHPTLEAITGVGNQVAYRGSLVVVFRDFNLTKNSSNRIPSFAFTVAEAGQPAFVIEQNDPAWLYKVEPSSLGEDYSATDLDDSSWTQGPGAFGYPVTALPLGSVSTVVGTGVGPNIDIWMRRHIETGPQDITLVNMIAHGVLNVFWNGALIWTREVYNTSGDTVIVPADQVLPSNALALQCQGGAAADVILYIDSVFATGVESNALPLSSVVQKLCLRGGLSTSDFNVTELADVNVLGYPIARQSTGADALTPLLAAFFSYASEYDAKVNFLKYGGDVGITIDEADLLAGNDANDGYITQNLRNQQTEFPRRIVANYYDPAQNYFTCQVPSSRIAIGVTSIGDQTLNIPVVMSANDAQKAVDKALKVAYATLEGTLQFSVPFAGASPYLSLAAGDPIIFRAKRYVLDEAVLSTNYIKLTARYDRQSAYTSNVQAIVGNAPVPPVSPYSGPSTLRAMNLPSLRPQDTYGMYLAACSRLLSPSSSWQGCTVQMSLDGQVTWNTVASIDSASTMGNLVLDEPSAAPHEPLTVQVNADLETISGAQIAAQANAFALKSAATGIAEVGQFLTATEQATVNEYQLTGTLRGLLGTTEALHVSGDEFTMLDNVYFVPIDASLTGTTIYFRTIGFGESVPDPLPLSVVYLPDTTIVYDAGVYTP